MKIVIQTQHRENYAFDENGNLGTGENAYWKFKGGDTYVVKCSFAEACDADFRNAAQEAVESKNDAFEEYVIDWEIIDDADFAVSNFCSDWESPTYLWFDGEDFVAHRTTENSEMGFMRSEIAKKYESWTMKNGERVDYQSSFEMVTGDQVPYAELSAFLERVAA